MKTKFKGTPGPWEYEDSSVVCSTKRKTVVAVAVSKTGRFDSENGKLIAAAPEMLEVLQEFVEAWESGLAKSIPALNQEPAYRKAKEVIAKAIGK